MSHSDVLDKASTTSKSAALTQKRRVINAFWQPFLQFKLLMYMLGSTAFVAVLLAAFLYFAFNDLVNVVTGKTEATSYYGEMIEIQLVHLFRYCGALFVLYIVLLASVCVAYTHRLIGPLRPFVRHVEKLTDGDYSSRVVLRKGDLDMYNEYAEKLNALAVKLNSRETHVASRDTATDDVQEEAQKTAQNDADGESPVATQDGAETQDDSPADK